MRKTDFSKTYKIALMQLVSSKRERYQKMWLQFTWKIWKI